MSGPAANPGVQAVLRGLDLRSDALRAQRWEQLLSTTWGRALVYELIYERGMVTAASFEPSIKDGVAMAQMTARNEGIREYAWTLLSELNDLFPDQMLKVHAEMTAVRQAERVLRQKATRSATTNED